MKKFRSNRFPIICTYVEYSLAGITSDTTLNLLLSDSLSFIIFRLSAKHPMFILISLIYYLSLLMEKVILILQFKKKDLRHDGEVTVKKYMTRKEKAEDQKKIY